MNKLLLGTAAVAMGFALATPAHAQVSLDLGGHYKGYLSWSDQDTSGGSDALSGENRTVEDNRALDWQQETEIHFTGETTLDNGLTVGFRAEADIDGGTFATEESYAYFSGAWVVLTPVAKTARLTCFKLLLLLQTTTLMAFVHTSPQSTTV